MHSSLGGESAVCMLLQLVTSGQVLFGFVILDLMLDFPDGHSFWHPLFFFYSFLLSVTIIRLVRNKELQKNVYITRQFSC